MVICVRKRIHLKLVDAGLRGRSRRREVESHVAEVFRVPRSVKCAVSIRGLLERKDETVDQGGDQADCYRRQRAANNSESSRKIHTP